jgi:ATP-dependent exoDNAse (exonuclease V) alpha subunit
LPDTSPYFDFELKPQQVEAFAALCDFVTDSTQKVFVLKGYAGTGKTTLMGGLIRRLQEDKIPFALLASTGRAAKILSDKTKTVANTIHSHIYSFKDLDQDMEQLSQLQQGTTRDNSGQITLLFDTNPIHSENEKIYIIDEASMVSDEVDRDTTFAKFGTGDLLGDLIRYDTNGRFIFVGDPCQLPPVRQVDSPALSVTHISDKYDLHTEGYELTDIVRQVDTSGIIEASLKLRTLYYDNPEMRFAYLPIRHHRNIHLAMSLPDLVASYMVQLQDKGYRHCTLIAQTNRHCTTLNNLIRQSLQRSLDTLCEGDLLMVTQNNYLSQLVNGDQVVVTRVGDRAYRCGLSFIQVEVQEIGLKTNYTLLLIEDVLTSTATNLDSRQHKELMLDFFNRMKAKRISQGDPEFKENMLKDPYLNALRCVYGYALTCHKAQGGEWQEVYLYLDNKIQGIPRPGIYQWLYTAVTRARETLHVADDWFVK